MTVLEDFLLDRPDLSEGRKKFYRCVFKAVGKLTDKPFTLSRKEMNVMLEKLKKVYRTKQSWKGAVACIRVVYKWRNGGEEYPDAVKHIKYPAVRREDHIKQQVLAESEVKSLLRGTDHPRNRALIAVARATGTRIGELAGMHIRDVEAKPEYNGYRIMVTGKTGTHNTPPIRGGFAKILRVWLEHHPDRDNPNAALWSRLKGGKVEGIKECQIHKVFKKAGLNAGVRIGKDGKTEVHVHALRHTENTWSTAKGVSRASRNMTHGWSPKSNTAAIYEHITDRDAENDYLRAEGVKQVVKKTDEFETVSCVYCGHENAATSKYCEFCGTVLDEKEAEEIVAKQKALDRAYELLVKRGLLDYLTEKAKKDGFIE